MKLRLPLYLLGCVLSLPLTMTASADTVGSGVFYDVGKISFSSDENAKTPEGSEVDSDTLYCWAAAGSNVMQYWQDTYIGKADNPASTPHTIIQGYEQPHGTDYLDIYNELLKHGKVDEAGMPDQLFRWWFKGETVTDSFDGHTIVDGQDGYYNNLTFEDDVVTVSSPGWYDDIPTFTEFVKTAFETQGQAVTLVIDGRDRETGEYGLYHVISCWGYELDEQGLVSSLIVSDSDDGYFGAFKVDVTPEAMADFDLDDVTSLSTEDPGCYLKSFNPIYVQSAHYINTPEAAQVVPVQNLIPDDGKVMVNTRIEKEAGQTVTGHGVTVGDDKTVVVLTSERGANLTLDGTGAPAADTGLKVTAGAMVSLVGDKDEQTGEPVGSVEVKNYQNGGMELTGKAYINDEKEVIISNNTKTGDGAGIATSSYLEIRNNDNVTISGNEATGKGGGIYNTGTVSIRGNSGLVVFEDNTAADGGNDIYNAQGGIVNIADNGYVLFKGTGSDKAAVVNDGVLYLQSGQVGEEGEEHPAEIIFNNSALDSTGGTTYVGQDVNGVKADTEVEFHNTVTGEYLNIAQRDKTVAVLDHLRVNASEIAGLGAKESSLTNALVTTTTDLRLSSMTFDNSNTFEDVSTDDHIVLVERSVITLSEDMMEHTGDKYNFDLGNMFDYTNMTLQNVYFDATGIGALAEGLKDGEYININFGLGDNVSAQVNNVVVRFANDMVTTDYKSLVRGNVEFRGTGVVPEPATSTLSLLALAGLAARRRRK